MKIVKYFILVTAIVLSSSCKKKSSKEDFNQISDRTESRTLQLVNDWITIMKQITIKILRL